jgi:hypothetical protein
MDYRELYQEELDRRDSIQAASSIPIGLLTVLGGVLVTILVGDPPLRSVLGWLFVTSYGSACVFFFEAAYYLSRSLHGRTYKLAPSADLLLAHEVALANWHNLYGTKKGADEDFNEYLASKYAAAAAVNREANVTKSEYLFRATRTTLYAGVFAAMSAVPYLVVSLGREQPPARIVLIADSTSRTGALVTEPKPSNPQPAPVTPPPPKPVGPPLQDMREGQIPKPRKP